MFSLTAVRAIGAEGRSELFESFRRGRSSHLDHASHICFLNASPNLLDEDAWFNREMEVAAFRFRHSASYHFSEYTFDGSFGYRTRVRTPESQLSPSLIAH
jgi:hypothetical protein